VKAALDARELNVQGLTKMGRRSKIENDLIDFLVFTWH
jgi:hypothetical protein